MIGVQHLLLDFYYQIFPYCVLILLFLIILQYIQDPSDTILLPVSSHTYEGMYVEICFGR